MNDAERTIVGLAEKQHGVISRRQALENGMSGRTIDHRLARRVRGALETRRAG